MSAKVCSAFWHASAFSFVLGLFPVSKASFEIRQKHGELKKGGKQPKLRADKQRQPKKQQNPHEQTRKND